MLSCIPRAGLRWGYEDRPMQVSLLPKWHDLIGFDTFRLACEIPATGKPCIIKKSVHGFVGHIYGKAIVT